MAGDSLVPLPAARLFLSIRGLHGDDSENYGHLHLIVFRYMRVTLKVKLLLSGDDSFTVSWAELWV